MRHRRHQQRHALDVVRHREQVEGAQVRQRVAVLREVADVAGEGGRVAGDVRHGARLERGDRADDLALGPDPRRVEHDEVGARRRRGAAPGRPGRRPTVAQAVRREVVAGSAREACGRPRRRRPTRRPDRLGQEGARTARRRRRGRATAPPAAAASEVEHALDQRARAPATCGCQNPSAGDLEARGAPAGGRRPCSTDACPASGSRASGCAIRQRSIGDDLVRAVLAQAAPPSGRWTYCIRVRQREPVGRAAPASTTTSRSSPASRDSCSATTAALSRRCSVERHVLEVAAAARPGPAYGQGARDPVRRGARAPRRRRRGGSGRRPR